MKLLLDTHTFIWWDSEPEQLSEKVFELFQNPGNTIMLSVVSVWEMHIKASLGKLALDRSLAELVRNQQTTNRIEILPVQLPHVLALDELPTYHKDPFDRLLIAQSIIEEAILLSKDTVISQYPVEVVW